jgi:alkylation response protein AidB-like acyl-CoA dehydrogenase
MTTSHLTLERGVDSSPTIDVFVERARALIPTLRERSRATEEARMLLPETVADFRRESFLRIASSKRFGGYQLGIHALVEVAFEIGRGCGSSAWMAGQWPGHNFMVGWFPEQGQQEYWAEGPDTISSTASSVARLDIQPEGEGYRVRDTQLRFSSGCDYAKWILMVSPFGMGLVPKSDFEVLDDWFVSGLRGTGSKSVVIRDAYIPPHRFVRMEDLKNCTTPGARINDDPYLRAPVNLVLNQLLCGAIVGMARGVQDIFEERVVKRKDLHTRNFAKEGPGAQLRFAESHAEVEVARLLQKNICEMLVDWGAREHLPTTEERARVRRDLAYAAKMAVQSTQRLLSQGDASGMFDDCQLGRLARDVYMAGVQVNLTWDEPAMTFSRTRWGVTPISNYT